MCGQGGGPVAAQLGYLFEGLEAGAEFFEGVFVGGAFAFEFAEEGGGAHFFAGVEEVFGVVGEVVELRGEAGGCRSLGGFAGIGAGVAAEDVVDLEPGGFGAVGGHSEPEDGVVFAGCFEDAAIGHDGIDLLHDPLVCFGADFEIFAVPAELELCLLIPADPDDVLDVLGGSFGWA